MRNGSSGISRQQGRRPLLPTRRPELNMATIVLGLAIVALLLLVGYPLLWLVLGAFGVPNEFSLEAFERVYSRAGNVEPLKNTLILALGTGALSIVLGVPLAWATARTDMPLRRVIQALVAVAYILPPYLTALAYILLLGPNAGHINRFLRWVFGFEQGPLNVFTMTGIIFVIGLHVFAFTYLLTYSALQAVDAPFEEAAQMLGANRWTVARRVTLPLVAPGLTGGVLLAAVESMALFGPQAFLGLPAQIVFLPTRIYGTLGSYPPRWAEASALSLVLVVFTVVGLYLQRGYLERRSFVTVSGRGVRTQRLTLGFWKWPLLAFCLTVVFFSAVAPVGVLAAAAFSKSWVAPLTLDNFTLANFQAALFQDQVAVRGIVNSFKLATGAAFVAVTLGLFIAYIDLRTNLRGRRLLDYLAVLPLGLPGTVMAVGILLAFIRPPIQIYGTIWILLVAYVGRFIPLAVRSVNAALRQIDPALEEAARISGASWGRTMWQVLMPMIRPGLLAAWLLVFIPALGELSATILLYSSGTETIAVAIYRLRDLGQLEIVSALSVFMIAVILVISLLLAWIANRGGRGVAIDVPTN